MARETPAPEKLAAWLDGEMPPEEAREFERLLEQHPEWREEAAEMAEVSSALKGLRYAPPPASTWDGYWDEIEPRLEKERVAGWIALAIGGAMLFAIGTYKILVLATNPLVRTGLVLVIVGLLVTFVSVVRGHLLERSRDRYRKVRR